MDCFIIAALSADGFIAKNEGQSSFGWTGAEDKKRFIELTKKAGVVVMGSTTYQTFNKPLKDRLNIVYSHSKTFEGIETTRKAPQELLQELAGRGLKEAAICGGSHIYTMFMEAGVVGRLYLTIEPVIFGNGIRLFTEEMDLKLELIDSTQTESGALLLEYAVGSH